MIASLSTDFLSVVHCFYVFDDVDFVWFLLNDHLNVSDDLIWFNDILNKSFDIFFLKLYFSFFIKLNLKIFEILFFVIFSLFVEFFETEPTSHSLEIGLETTFSSLVLLLSWNWSNFIRSWWFHWQLIETCGDQLLLIDKVIQWSQWHSSLNIFFVILLPFCQNIEIDFLKNWINGNLL